MRKLLKKQGFAPSVITTDKLRSYAAAFSDLGLSARHEQGLRKNNRAEVLPPAQPSSRTKDATVQVARFSSAIPLHVFCRLQHLQHPAASDLPPNTAKPPSRSHEPLAVSGGGRITCGRLLGHSFWKLRSCDNARIRPPELHGDDPNLPTEAMMPAEAPVTQPPSVSCRCGATPSCRRTRPGRQPNDLVH